MSGQGVTIRMDGTLNQCPSECLDHIIPSTLDIRVVDMFGRKTLLFPFAVWEILCPQFVVARTIRSSQIFEHHILNVI